MLQRLLLLALIQFDLTGSALAEPTKLTGEALRQAVSGRTVLIATSIGPFPIRYKSNGTMTGQAPALFASLRTEKDWGKWWVANDRLCQRWYRWLDAKRYCFQLRRLDDTVYWLRDDGASGTATIRGLRNKAAVNGTADSMVDP